MSSTGTFFGSGTSTALFSKDTKHNKKYSIKKEKKRVDQL